MRHYHPWSTPAVLPHRSAAFHRNIPTSCPATEPSLPKAHLFLLYNFSMVWVSSELLLFMQKSPNYFKMREMKCKIEECHKYEVVGRRGASFQTQIIKTPSFTAIVIACNGSTWKLLSQTSSVNIFSSNPCSTRSLPGHAPGLKHEKLHAHAINSFIAF